MPREVGHLPSEELRHFEWTLRNFAIAAYRSEVRGRDGRPSMIRRLSVERRGSRALQLNAEHASGFNFHFRVEIKSARALWDELIEQCGASAQQRRTCAIPYERWFAEELEDELLRDEERRLAAGYRQIMERTSDPTILYEAHEAYHQAVQTLREHRAVGHRLSPGLEMGGLHRRVTERLDQQIQEQFFGTFAPEPAAEQPVFTLERLYALVHTLGLQAQPGRINRSEAREQEAEERGLKLLREHLSPEQLAEYNEKRYFHVVGGETGHRYRILHGRHINIRLMASSEGEDILERLCFVPQGGLVAGDVMLTQKFALELQESAALKVANRFPPETTGPVCFMGIDLARLDDRNIFFGGGIT